jgi:D5 N terminal like/Bifunctional DNA primase/polymerase, N-terminal
VTPVLEIARAYLRRGWAPIPVPFRRKRCVLDGWERLRISEPELTRYFNGELQNIGVLLGDVSGGLVDIDLDAPEALALAAAFLPNTDARFGRAGKPESHWLYVVAIAPETVAFRDPEAGLADGKSMVVEIRSQHVQTVFPGSVHESGEPIVWSAAGEPARVEAATLWTTVRRLAAAALLGRHWPPAGGRHEASLATAGLLLRGGVDEATTAQIIQSAARVAGDEEWRERPKDVVTTAARLARGESATGAPRLATVLRGEGAKVVHRLREWLGLRLPRPHLTDAGNAERFAGQHREDVRYVYAWRCWLFWDGTRWRRDAGDIAMRLAKETVRTIYSEAAADSDAEERKRIAAWAKLSESEPRLRAMLALAQSEPGIPVTPAELDRDPFLLNCPNGTLELRTMALRLHRREDLLTKLAAARFDPDARHPTWTAFLERVLPTPALRTFVQRVAGYCLTGDTSDGREVLLRARPDGRGQVYPARGAP